MEFRPGLKSKLGHAQLFCFPGNEMAAAIKEKRFQWNKGDKTLFRHAKIFPPTPIWNIFPYHILPPFVRASIYNPDRPALSTNSASLEISSLSLQIRLSS